MLRYRFVTALVRDSGLPHPVASRRAGRVAAPTISPRLEVGGGALRLLDRRGDRLGPSCWRLRRSGGGEPAAGSLARLQLGEQLLAVVRCLLAGLCRLALTDPASLHR
jgi:hypothetical protein